MNSCFENYGREQRIANDGFQGGVIVRYLNITEVPEGPNVCRGPEGPNVCRGTGGTKCLPRSRRDQMFIGVPKGPNVCRGPGGTKCLPRSRSDQMFAEVPEGPNVCRGPGGAKCLSGSRRDQMFAGVPEGPNVCRVPEGPNVYSHVSLKFITDPAEPNVAAARNTSRSAGARSCGRLDGYKHLAAPLRPIHNYTTT